MPGRRGRWEAKKPSKEALVLFSLGRKSKEVEIAVDDYYKRFKSPIANKAVSKANDLLTKATWVLFDAANKIR